MMFFSSSFKLSACALAASVLISACGGGTESTDKVPPTVAITAAAGASGTAVFTFTFSEDVGNSFVAEDIAVTGGTAGSLVKVDAKRYTLTVTSSNASAGTIAVSIAAAKFKDVALNDNTQVAEASYAFGMVADFDTVIPVVGPYSEGGTGTITTTPPTGGTGSALALLRSGGQAWALNVLTATVPFTATRKTLSARVYSPTAGIPMKIKIEAVGGGDTGEVAANETVVVGWQTLTWTFTNADISKTYNTIVLLPNIGTVDAAPGKTYYFDDIKLLPAPVVTIGTMVADFDIVIPVVGPYSEGGTGTITTTPPTGGTGSALALLRSGGQAWALNVLTATVPFTATRKTLSARVYSPTAGIPMKIKIEAVGGGDTGEVAANETVVVGWQTLTWTFTNADITKTYNTIVLLPNIGTVDAAPGKTYYFDDIKLLPAAVVATDTTVADFDTVIPVVGPYSEGGTGTITTTPPTGGTGSALALLRSGGQAWALNVLTATVPFTATRKTLSARVYSPTAGIPMKIKIEAVGGGDTGEVAANETVVVGWQTLTWTFTNADISKTYNTIVLLPNIGTVDAAPGKTYYFDDIKLLPAPVVTIGTMVADFDIVIPVVGPYSEGGTGTITTTPPTGGTGSALALLRSGGQAWALNVLTATVPFTATRKTLSARVYSPTAGIPMKIKIEAVGGGDTGEVAANETVVVGWQTLTWTFTNADISKTYNTIVLLPNIGTVDAAPGKTYYFDDIKLLAAASGSGSTTAVEMGAGGAQTLTIATGDVKTGDGGNTMFVANEGIFAVNYEGSAESTAPYNLAAWPSAKTAAFTGLTGVSGGTIGYYQDDVNLSNSSQKVDEGGWVAGTAVSPNGVPNFFRYFVLKAAVSADAYMGLYVNAPNNGTVSTSNFTKIKFKVWGPAPMFERNNFNPVLEMTLAGPKVAGCTTGSGGTEITQTFTANLKNGAGGAYTLPFSGFTVKGLCGSDTSANAVANVRASLARVVINVPGTSFNFTNLDGGNYATGVNLGPIGFTNN